MNTKNLIIAIAALIIVIGGAFYVGRMYYSAPTNNNDTNIPSGGNNVSIEKFSFKPQTLTVKTGEKVTWTNNDSVPHNIKMGAVTSDTFSKGGSYEYTFQNKGSYDYSCGIHPSMTGKIIVE